MSWTFTYSTFSTYDSNCTTINAAAVLRSGSSCKLNDINCGFLFILCFYYSQVSIYLKVLNNVKRQILHPYTFFYSTFNMMKTRPCTIHLCSEYNYYFTICTQNMVLNWFHPFKMQSRMKKKNHFKTCTTREPSIQRGDTFIGRSYSGPKVKNVSWETKHCLWNFCVLYSPDWFSR